MAFSGTIDGPYLMRQYLGLQSVSDIQNGAAVLAAPKATPVISGQGATVTLTAAQSGALCLFDRAAGIVYTLPAAIVGTYFRFFVTTTITSNSAKIITSAGTIFLLGEPLVYIDNTTPGANPGPKGFAFDGANNVACTMNGSTSGGVIGTDLEFLCVSATQWIIRGVIVASGTIGTAAANS
jgi:hypothetical protein